MATSCLWTEDIRLKTNQFGPFAAMLVTEFCCDLQSVRANERSLVASVESLGYAIWTGFTGAWVGRLNVLVQTVGGVEGV